MAIHIALQVKQFQVQRPIRDLNEFITVSDIPQELPDAAVHSATAPPPLQPPSRATRAAQPAQPTQPAQPAQPAPLGSQGSHSSHQSQHPAAAVCTHNVGEFVYEWRAEGAPTVQLWVTEPGVLGGLVQGTGR